jgi:citrate lyase beta subunit
VSASLVAMLSVPGADEGKLAKVGQLDASAYILDLEDAVAAAAKPLARELVAATLDRAAADAAPAVALHGVRVLDLSSL